MVSRPFRLVKASDLQRVARRGRRVRGAYATLEVLKTHRPQSRFAVVASTRVSKKAVIRNRLRRRTYEHIRVHLPVIAEGFDCAIRLLPQSVAAPRKEFLRALDIQLLQAGLLQRVKTMTSIA